MKWLHNMKRSLRPAKQSERRRYRRFRTDQYNLNCDQGQIVDLSKSGMRVISPTKAAVKVGQKTAFVIREGKNSLKVRGKIIRVKRAGLRSFEVAAHFTNVSTEAAQILETIGRKGIITKIPLGSIGSENGQEAPQFEMLDPYKVLGVPHDASDETIRSTYRRLAKKFHPDISGSKGCIDKFSRVDSAYKFLRDPEVRRIYDKLMTDGTSQ